MKDINKKDLVISRTFEAPISAVWKARTDPETLMQRRWPAGYISPSATINLHEGKTSIIAMRAPKRLGGQDTYSSRLYTRIIPEQHIEFISNLSDVHGKKTNPRDLWMPDDFPMDVRSVITFQNMGKNKTKLSIKEFDWTIGQMFELSKMGREQSLDKMAKIFTNI